MFKTKIKNRLKKVGLVLMICLTLSVNFLQPFGESVTYAQATPAPTQSTPDPGSAAFDPGTVIDSTLNQATSDAYKNLSLTQKAISTIIWPVLILIGNLMDNSLLFGAGMEERMRELWIPIRNLVNLLFILGMVGIAIYNILGIGEDNYSIKNMLPKLILGIIAVNFSFFGIKVILDGVNVVTSAIFALPAQVSTGSASTSIVNLDDQDLLENFCAEINGVSRTELLNNFEEIYERNFRNEILNVLGSSYPTVGQGIVGFNTLSANEMLAEARATLPPADYDNLTNRLNQNFTTFCQINGTTNEIVASNQARAYFSKYSQNNAALAIALAYSNMVYYDDVSLKTDTVDKLVISSIIVLIMYIVYAASFLALFAVLIARLVVMWVAVVMSPLLLLGMAIPVLRDKIGLIGKLSEEFVRNAIAPITIAISMTIGWIMLGAMRSVNNFAFSSGEAGFPIQGLGTVQDIIVAIGIVGIIWVGVWGAASNTIAGPVVDLIKNGLSGGLKYLVGAPLKKTPFIYIKNPTPGGQDITTSPSQIMTTLRDLRNMGADDDHSLTHALKLDSSLTPNEAAEAIRKSGIGKDFASYLLNDEFLKDKKFIEVLKDLKRSNDDRYRNLPLSIRTAFDKFLNEQSDENKQTLQEKIRTEYRGIEAKIKPDTQPTSPVSPSVFTPKTISPRWTSTTVNSNQMTLSDAEKTRLDDIATNLQGGKNNISIIQQSLMDLRTELLTKYSPEDLESLKTSEVKNIFESMIPEAGDRSIIEQQIRSQGFDPQTYIENLLKTNAPPLPPTPATPPPTSPPSGTP